MVKLSRGIIMIAIKSNIFDFELRQERLDLALKDLLNPGMSVMYVGARADRIQHIDTFKDCEVTILEISKVNIEELRLLDYEIVEGDIRQYKPKGEYDIVFWSHGPEHLNLEDIPVTLLHIEDYTNIVVVLMCPWGVYEQDIEHDNVYERHLSHLQPEIFEKLGYTVEVQGDEGVGSNMMGVKCL